MDEFDAFCDFDVCVILDDGDQQRRAGRRIRASDYGDPIAEKLAQVVVGGARDAGAESWERREGVEEE